jgi:Outer membrane protein beta-barrel domain
MTNYFTFTKTADGSRDILAISKILLLICLVGFTGTRLHAQAIPTASAAGDLQIGAMFNFGDSDYRPQKFKGYGFYTTFDFRYHVGIEGEFHQLNDPDATDGVYERTYEIGPRYVLRHGRYNPYAKIMYGRGVFNYPPVFGDPKIGPAANLAYNLGAIGAGVDYRVVPAMNVRVDYEYQKWLSFDPLAGLSWSFCMHLAINLQGATNET